MYSNEFTPMNKLSWRTIVSSLPSKHKHSVGVKTGNEASEEAGNTTLTSEGILIAKKKTLLHFLYVCDAIDIYIYP